MAYIHKPENGKWWRAQFYRRGIRKSASFETREDAERWVEKMNEGFVDEFSAVGRIAPPRSRRKKQPIILPKNFIGLRTKEEILKSAISAAPVCGVYFLINEGRLIYIGQSIDVWARLTSHRNTGVQFNKVTIIPCKPDRLSILESRYILQFQPPFNFKKNGKLRISSKRCLAEINGDLLPESERQMACTDIPQGSSAVGHVSHESGGGSMGGGHGARA